MSGIQNCCSQEARNQAILRPRSSGYNGYAAECRRGVMPCAGLPLHARRRCGQSHPAKRRSRGVPIHRRPSLSPEHNADDEYPELAAGLDPRFETRAPGQQGQPRLQPSGQARRSSSPGQSRRYMAGTSGRERGLPITTPPNRPRKGKNDRACHRPGCRSALPPRRHAGSCLRQNSGPAANTARQRQNSGQSSSRSRRPAHKAQQGTRKLALPARTRTWCRWGQNCPDSPPECALARKAAGHKRRRN